MAWHIRRITSEHGTPYIVGRVAGLKDDAAAVLSVEHSTGSFSLSKGSISLSDGSFFWRKNIFCFRMGTIDNCRLSVNIRVGSDCEECQKTDVHLNSIKLETNNKLDPGPWLEVQSSNLAKGVSFRDLWAHAYKGLATWYEPFVIEALRAALPRSTKHAVKAEIEAYARCFDTLCDLLNYDDECRRLCESDALINGDTFWSTANFGHLAYRRQDWAAVDALYTKAALLSTSFNVIHFNRGTRSWRGKDFTSEVDARTLDDGLTQILQSPIETALPNDGDIIHFVGCDTGYLERFLPFMLNAHVDDSGAVLHVHVSNPSAGAKSLLAALGRSDLIKLNYSFDFPHEEFLRPEYYTCVRFLFAPIIDKYRTQKLFITDVDISLSMPWNALLKIVNNSVAGFRYNGSMSSIFDYSNYYGPPWSVNAQTSYYSPEPQARRLLEFQSKYIQSLICKLAVDPKASFWTIDQVAMRIGLDRYFDPSAASRIVNLSLHPLMSRAPKDNVGLRMQVDTQSDRGRRLAELIASVTR